MRRIAVLTLVFLFCLVLTASPQVQPQAKIITFDVPVADEFTPHSGTFPCCINTVGFITGTYLDANGVRHGFLRAPNGHITTFDVPNSAGMPAIHGMNDLGMITGDYFETDGIVHGFLRVPDGNFTSFDGPGAGLWPWSYEWGGTAPRSINQLGVTAGNYLDGNGTAHGFVRTPDGKITVIDAPGGGPYFWQGTWINSINLWGALSGGVVDSGGVGHQFVRTPRGTYEIYNDAPDAVTGQTFSTSINVEGAVAGQYLGANEKFHGFLRTPDGKITEFDPPGATAGTFSDGINPFGLIVGFYGDQYSVWHGYVRTPDGKFVTFDAPGTAIGAGQGIGAACASDQAQSVPCVAINFKGVIAGSYLDENNVSHGFVRLPQPWSW